MYSHAASRTHAFVCPAKIPIIRELISVPRRTGPTGIGAIPVKSAFRFANRFWSTYANIIPSCPRRHFSDDSPVSLIAYPLRRRPSPSVHASVVSRT